MVMVLVKKHSGKIQVNGPVRQKDRTNKQRKVERQRKKWAGKRNLESRSGEGGVGGGGGEGGGGAVIPTWPGPLREVCVSKYG